MNRSKTRIFIGGMTCVNCQNKIETALLHTAGIETARVSYQNGTADLVYDPDWITLEEIQQVIRDAGYEVLSEKARNKQKPGRAAHILIVIAVLYALLENSGILNRLVPSQLADTRMGYGMLFVIGLLTSVHCIAMCGGINVASAGNARRSAILYNLGRVVSYTLVGAIVGALGSAFSLSTAVQAGIQLFAAAFMLAMALNLLGCFRFLPSLRLPGRLSGLFRSRSSFVIGLANGLMPCGPLQAMQLFALSTGSWYMGALSMFCFSLGTVPLMLGVGLISGTLNRRFAGPMRIACAALVAVMGMSMLQNALSLAGFAAPAAVQPESTEDGVAYFSDGVQLVHTTLDYRSYAPITVKAGIPVRWTITADSRVLNGCNEALVIPEYSIQKGLAPGDNIIEFTPAEIGTFPYSCWMGMIRSSITVEP